MRRIISPAVALTLNYTNNPTTIDSVAQNHNGYLQNVYVTLPSLDGGATATLNIKDSHGNVIYTKATIAGNQTTLCTPTAQIPLGGSIIYEIVTSANQTANKSITILPYIDQFL